MSSGSGAQVGHPASHQPSHTHLPQRRPFSQKGAEARVGERFVQGDTGITAEWQWCGALGPARVGTTPTLLGTIQNTLEVVTHVGHGEAVSGRGTSIPAKEQTSKSRQPGHMLVAEKAAHGNSESISGPDPA